MSDVAEASGLIRQVVPRNDMDKGEWLNAAVQRLRAIDRRNKSLSREEKERWTFNRAYTIWHQTCRIIQAWEMDALRRARDLQERRDNDAAKKLERARAEYLALTQSEVSRLASTYSETDPDFHRPQIDALAAIAARWIAPEIAEDQGD